MNKYIYEEDINEDGEKKYNVKNIPLRICSLLLVFISTDFYYISKLNSIFVSALLVLRILFFTHC